MPRNKLTEIEHVLKTKDIDQENEDNIIWKDILH